MNVINSKRPVLALIFPCYNEEKTLHYTFQVSERFLEEAIAQEKISSDSFLLFVDDGSKDKTWLIIEEKASSSSRYRGLKLAGNVGHQNALYAGMMDALNLDVDAAISLDADLQDDINSAYEMIDAFRNGDDIVYGVRDDRSSDTFLKKWTATSYYWILNKLGVNIIPQHADYRLCSRRVLEAVKEYKEVDLFLRALFPALGFQTSNVYYSREIRKFGTTKYSIPKMFSFAWRGITSFSSAPLRITGLFSFIFFIIALVQTGYVISAKISGETISGWPSLMLVILLFSSVQLFCLTIIGEYIAKLFLEVKRRPRYIVEKRV